MCFIFAEFHTFEKRFMCAERQTDRRTDGQTEGRMEGWTEEQAEGSTEGRMNTQIDRFTKSLYLT